MRNREGMEGRARQSQRGKVIRMRNLLHITTISFSPNTATSEAVSRRKDTHLFDNVLEDI